MSLIEGTEELPAGFNLICSGFLNTSEIGKSRVGVIDHARLCLLPEDSV